MLEPSENSIIFNLSHFQKAQYSITSADEGIKLFPLIWDE